jgi:ammonium transporter Rh
MCLSSYLQNATLAGGVAIGSSANLFMEPGGALATGLVAGSVSTLGYAFAQPYLEAKFGLRDTCGVHNLHGMPGVLGGLVSAIVSFFNYAPNAYMFERGAHQWVWQVVGLAVTLIIAVTSGALTGLALKYGCPKSGLEYMFDDAHAWVMEEEGKEEAGYEHLDGNPT